MPIGTSATIKSVDEEGRTREEVTRLRDEAVQEFFSRLAGVEAETIRVLGEELEDVHIPTAAAYPPAPAAVDLASLRLDDAERVRVALCRLAGVPGSLTLDDAAQRCRLL